MGQGDLTYLNTNLIFAQACGTRATGGKWLGFNQFLYAFELCVEKSGLSEEEVEQMVRSSAESPKKKPVHLKSNVKLDNLLGNFTLALEKKRPDKRTKSMPTDFI